MGSSQAKPQKRNFCALPPSDLSDATVRVRVAVLGRSGVGKSSLINALLGREAYEAGAAQTGVTECTTEVAAYCVPWCPYLRLYDTPGYGTPLVSWDKYVDGMCLDEYDAIILVNSDRFTEQDRCLVARMRQIGKKYFFVRTKVDQAIRCDQEDYPTTHKESEVLAKIAMNYIPQLEEAGDTQADMFLTSSRRNDRNSEHLCRLKVYLTNLEPRCGI